MTSIPITEIPITEMTIDQLNALARKRAAGFLGTVRKDLLKYGDNQFPFSDDDTIRAISSIYLEACESVKDKEIRDETVAESERYCSLKALLLCNARKSSGHLSPREQAAFELTAWGFATEVHEFDMILGSDTVVDDLSTKNDDEIKDICTKAIPTRLKTPGPLVESSKTSGEPARTE